MEVVKESLKISDVTKNVSETLGVKMVAVITGVKSGRTIKRWGEGSQNPLPKRRMALHNTLSVLELLKEKESAETIKAWFIGANPELNFQAPALAISKKPNEVILAAKTFLAHG